jgi:hypothetical protein
LQSAQRVNPSRYSAWHSGQNIFGQSTTGATNEENAA